MTISYTKPADNPFGRAVLIRVLLAARLLADGIASRIAMKRSLGRLSDRHLRDIGLTRGDIDAALYEPFSADVSERLARIARMQSENW